MKEDWTLWPIRLAALAGGGAGVFAMVSLSRWSRLDARLEGMDATSGAYAAAIAGRARAEFQGAVAAGVAVIAVVFLAIALSSALRRARALTMAREAERDAAMAEHARLREAIESLNEGFVLFDSDDKLLVCNQRFREIYGEIADCLAPGQSYEEIKRQGALRGLFAEAASRETEWLAENMAERRRFTPRAERLSGNRWVMVSNRPTRDGGFVGVRSDITELKRREMELSEARNDLERQAERMRALAEDARNARDTLRDAIESINEGFSLFDADDHLALCNSRWLDLHAAVRDKIHTGAAYADILRAAIAAGHLVAADNIEAEVASRVAARRAEERTSVEERFADDRWINVSTRRMSGGGIVSVLSDITTLKLREFALGSTRARLEKQAREMSSLAEQAQRANRAKSDFLAMMSHEIRTPLNGVISALGLVADRELPAGALNLVDTARASARSLLSILNDVLDMSKIEAGKLELEPAPFRLRDLVDGVASLCGAQAREKGLEFHARLADDAPEWVVGDLGRIRQMALNYATNAVKFTDRGAIELEVTRSKAGGDVLRFEVVDSGIGIPLEQHGRVFRDFTQLDQSLSRRYGGTGLGLAITRRLARAMGGTIGFDSTEGVGSAFWFEIPLPTAEPASKVETIGDEAVAAEVSLIARRAPRVLLVEDNDTNRLLARMTLERMGCGVAEALDGARAVETAAGGGFSGILMDISMPVMDGFEAARQIRATGDQTPILALTAHTGVGFEAECVAAGMNGCLTKPLDRASLRRWLAGLDSAPDRLKQATVARGFDPSPLRAMRDTLGEDGFHRVLASARKDIAGEARAMAVAFANPDAPDSEVRARHAAHKMAGLASVVGAQRLERLARLVETGAAGLADRLAIAPAAQAALARIDALAAEGPDQRRRA